MQAFEVSYLDFFQGNNSSIWLAACTEDCAELSTANFLLNFKVCQSTKEMLRRQWCTNRWHHRICISGRLLHHFSCCDSNWCCCIFHRLRHIAFSNSRRFRQQYWIKCTRLPCYSNNPTNWQQAFWTMAIYIHTITAVCLHVMTDDDCISQPTVMKHNN